MLRRLFALCCLLSTALPLPALGDEALEGIEHLNRLRVAAGLNPLQRDPELTAAARNHAEYLQTHRMIGHGERPGDAGFTGNNAVERALYANYASRAVSENVSAVMGDRRKGMRMAVEDLFTAIYHRTIFLAFDIDRVGAAFVSDGNGNSKAAFSMGNGRLNALCREPAQPIGFAAYYRDVCRDRERRVPAAAFEAAATTQKLANPLWVQWPYPGQAEVQPMFADEIPDPLPEVELSGNPVSLHFNPERVQRVELHSFELFDAAGNALREVRLLRQENDPNRLLGGLDFALFPLKPLDWGASYRARASVTVDGERQILEWRFTTRQPPEGLPLYKVARNGEQLTLHTGHNRFLVFIDPATAGRVLSVSARALDVAAIEANIVESNTLLLDLRGVGPAAHATVTLSGGFNFELSVEGTR